MDRQTETHTEIEPERVEQPEEPPRNAPSTLRHMEKLLAEIRGSLDASARDGEHREFSTVKTVGAILQVVVGGLLILALLGWMLDARWDGLMLKLAFAAVLQLCALTAFIVGGVGRK